MSAALALGAIIVAIPVGALVIFLLGYIAYGLVARDIAQRLRARAELFERNSKLPELVAGIRYAADTIECWGKR